MRPSASLSIFVCLYVATRTDCSPCPSPSPLQVSTYTNAPGCVADGGTSVLAVCAGASYSLTTFPSLDCTGTPTLGPVDVPAGGCFNTSHSSLSSSLSLSCPAAYAALFPSAACQGPPSANVVQGLCEPFAYTNAEGAVASGVVAGVCSGPAGGQLLFYTSGFCAGTPSATVDVGSICGALTLTLGNDSFALGGVRMFCPAAAAPSPSAAPSSSPSPAPAPAAVPPGVCLPTVFGYTYPNGTVVPISTECVASSPDGCLVVTRYGDRDYYLHTPMLAPAAAGTYAFASSCSGS